jgi:hypothetical protein
LTDSLIGLEDRGHFGIGGVGKRQRIGALAVPWTKRCRMRLAAREVKGLPAQAEHLVGHIDMVGINPVQAQHTRLRIIEGDVEIAIDLADIARFAPDHRPGQIGKAAAIGKEVVGSDPCHGHPVRSLGDLQPEDRGASGIQIPASRQIGRQGRSSSEQKRQQRDHGAMLPFLAPEDNRFRLRNGASIFQSLV